MRVEKIDLSRPDYKVWQAAFYLVLLWYAAVLVSPVMMLSESRLLQQAATLFYFLADPVCHQLPERSFWLQNIPFPVCMRCTMIYGGMVILLAAVKLTGHLVRLSARSYIYSLAVLVTIVVVDKFVLADKYVELRLVSGLAIGLFIGQALSDRLLPDKQSISYREADGKAEIL